MKNKKDYNSVTQADNNPSINESPVIDMTDDEKIDFVARRILD